MKKVAIVTDSTADIPPEVAARHGIRVIPCQLLIAGRVYRDGVDMQAAEFYHILREGKVTPTTSQPATGEFISAYQDLSQTAESIVSIHISSLLSGTVEFAHTAIAQMQAQAVRGIHVVDSRLVSMALGLVVLAAADMAERGLDAPEIVARVSALCPKVRALFIVDTLEYLHRGGRIGGAERFFGSVLSIKPLLQIADGRVEALEKTRTKQRALVRLLEVMGGWIGSASRLHIAVAHADALEDALHLKAEIETRFRQPVSYVCEFTPVVGVHGGPGRFGATFYPED